MKMPFESHTVPAYFVSRQLLLSSLLPSRTEKTPLRQLGIAGYWMCVLVLILFSYSDLNSLSILICILDVDNIVERVANIMTAEDEQSLTKSWRTQFEE